MWKNNHSSTPGRHRTTVNCKQSPKDGGRDGNQRLDAGTCCNNSRLAAVAICNLFSSRAAYLDASAAASTVPPATSTIPSSSSSSSHYSMPPLLSTLWAGMAGQPQPQAAACVCRVMCFERVDTREWEIRDCRVAVADVIGKVAQGG